MIAGIARPDARPRRDRRPRAVRQRGAASTCRRSSGASATCSRTTRCSRTSTVRQNIALRRCARLAQPARARRATPTVERWLDAFELRGGRRATTRTSSRAASASAPRSPARWCRAARRCCSTSRSRRSTGRCAQRLRDELRDLQAQLRIPMLLITHDEDDVAAPRRRGACSCRGRRASSRAPLEPRPAACDALHAHRSQEHAMQRAEARDRAARAARRRAGSPPAAQTWAGSERIALLRAVAEHGSITQAAKAVRHELQGRRGTRSTR